MDKRERWSGVGNVVCGLGLPRGCSSLRPRNLELAQRQMRSTFWAEEGVARAGVCLEAPRPMSALLLIHA